MAAEFGILSFACAFRINTHFRNAFITRIGYIGAGSTYARGASIGSRGNERG
jgi:hypothetical protein